MRAGLLIACLAAAGACADRGAPDSGGAADDTGAGETAAPDAPLVWWNERFEVSVDQDAVYGRALARATWQDTDGLEIDLLVDVYRPEGLENARPALLLIHGGGFLEGSRSQNDVVDYANWFASRGFVVASIDYRVEGHHGSLPDWWQPPEPGVLPDYLPDDTSARWQAFYPAGRDAQAALRWLVSQGPALYGVDPGYVAVAGGSAGGFLAALVGAADPADYRDELDVTQDPTLESTWLDVAPEPAAVLVHWGAPTLLLALEHYDGAARFDADDPPLIAFHGAVDDLVPPDNGSALVDAWGASSELVLLEGQPHSAWSATVDGASLHEIGLAFAVEAMGLRASD